MPEGVFIDKEHGVVVIKSNDLVLKDTLLLSLKSVLSISRQEGMSKVMIDIMDLISPPSSVTLFNFASELSSETFGMKHAVIVSKQPPKGIRFLEFLALKRGADLQIFNSKNEALSWFNNQINMY